MHHIFLIHSSVNGHLGLLHVLAIVNSAVMNIRVHETFFFFFFLPFRAAPAAYGSSQARGQIRTTAAILHHSNSKAGYELCLQPTPQLTATMDRQPTKQGQGSNPYPHASYCVCRSCVLEEYKHFRKKKIFFKEKKISF